MKGKIRTIHKENDRIVFWIETLNGPSYHYIERDIEHGNLFQVNENIEFNITESLCFHVVDEIKKL